MSEKNKIKQKIILELKKRVNHEIALASEVSKTNSSFKQDSDMKQEGKYDTRSIEAGYLASAQAKRVEELKLELQQLDDIPLRDYGEGDVVALGAIVELELDHKTRNYFISSTAGGSMVTVNDYDILIISVFSPIGHEALGLKVGDTFELETKSSTRIYTIKSIA